MANYANSMNNVFFKEICIFIYNLLQQCFLNNNTTMFSKETLRRRLNNEGIFCFGQKMCYIIGNCDWLFMIITSADVTSIIKK
jgi:hypothetical protein